MLNHIVIMGRLTRDPELRYTQSGVAVASFTVACEHDYAGQGQQRGVDFIDCVAWRQGGEFVHKYFHKGQMIVVDGRLESRKWQDRDGNNRTSWEINAAHTYFGEPKQDNGQGYQQQYGGYQQAPQQGYGGGYQQQGYGGYSPPQNAQQGGFQPAGAPRNVYPGNEFQEMDGPGDGNPFVGQQQTQQQAQAQQYGGQQRGMWDELNDEADGELPF